MHRMFFNPYRERFGAVHIVTDDDLEGKTYTHAIDVPKHLRAEAASVLIDASVAGVLNEAPDMGETAFDYIKRRTADAYRQACAAAQT